MTISGFTIIRNGVKLDYPFVEAIMSILPVCTEVIVCIGQCEDETEAYIKAIDSPKIKIIYNDWNLENRIAGTELAIQTSFAMQHITGDWGFYIQADEVLPDGYAETILNACTTYNNNKNIEGFVFDYVHFYGNYQYVAQGRNWYRKEIRIVRNNIGVYSYGDAQGFRINNRKLNCKHIHTPIYHYGHVRKPEGYKIKNLEMSKMWHSDQEIATKFDATKPFIYENKQVLKHFTGKHPEIMLQRIAGVDWQFIYDQKTVQQKLKNKILDTYENITGKRLFEYRNFKLI
jgi:hypothetical protein